MKKVINVLCILFFSVSIHAQENNPSNKVGKDLLASINLVKDDFKNGKVKEFSKEAIQEYSNKLPLKVEVDIDLVSKVYTTIKDKNFNISKFISESNVSNHSKEVLLTMATNPKNLDVKQMQEYLKTEVDYINSSKMDNHEKEFILSLVSFVFNESESAQPCYCTYSGPNGSGPLDCTTCGALVGGIIGWAICGPLCGLGGAIIGGIVGSMS